jgi:nitrite reductase/ring-hydroxylating ferredoxin subunit
MQHCIDELHPDSLVEGNAVIVNVNEKQIAIIKSKGRIYAIGNECPHLGGPLGEGSVVDGKITCPWHDWTFDLHNGNCEINPAAGIEKYQLKILDGKIWIFME